MTDKVNRYEPPYQHIKLESPDYVLLDPSRQVAAVKEQGQRFQEQAQNTARPNVALADVLGSSGQEAGHVADINGNYENQNVGIVNNAYAHKAGIANQEAEMNNQYDKQYMDEMATLNQQFDNEMRARKYRQLATFNQGITNEFHRKMQEKVLTPQVHINPYSGDVDFSGNGKNIFAPSGFYGENTSDSMQKLKSYNDMLEQWGITGKDKVDLLKTFITGK